MAEFSYFYMGPNYRHVVNSVGITLKAYWLLTEMVFVFADYQWLIKANRLFQQIPLIQISNKSQRLISPLRMIVRGISFSFVVCSSAVFLANPFTRNAITMENFYQYLPGIYVPVSMIVHSWYAGFAVTRMYLLMHLSADWSVQFRQKSQRVLEKQWSNKSLASVTGQFNKLYMMLQYVNSTLQIEFGIMFLWLFAFNLEVFYLSFYAHVPSLIKYVTLGCSIINGLLVVYFSYLSGTVDKQLEKLSSFIYYKVVVVNRNYTLSKQISCIVSLTVENITLMSVFILVGPVLRHNR